MLTLCAIAIHDFLSSDFLSSMNFGQVTDRQTEYDAYEPTVHTHRWAQKMQLDVRSEPNLSTAQALCLLISHSFYYK